MATVDHEPARIDIPFVQRVLDERGPTGAHVTELSWTTEFQVQHRIAKTFRSGQVFLAGDAAHVHSPAGGQGMNLGIQDAVDLAHTLIKALEGTQPGEPHLDG